MNRDILLYRLCPVHRIYDCCNSDTNFDCKDCIRVMNERLDEYDNHVIEQYKANTRLNDKIREIHDNVAKEMYCKGIDDFVERLTTYLGIENATKYGNKNAEQMRNSYGTFMNYEIAESIEDVAKQLKAGDKE